MAPPVVDAPTVPPVSGHVNTNRPFRVDDHTTLTPEAVSIISAAIFSHDQQHTPAGRGARARLIQRELGDTNRQRALNTARRIRKHAQRARIII